MTSPGYRTPYLICAGSCERVNTTGAVPLSGSRYTTGSTSSICAWQQTQKPLVKYSAIRRLSISSAS